MNWRTRMVAAGQFFFRYRNALFPVVFVLIVPLIRSQVLFGSRSLTWGLSVAGALIACAGEALRLATIGFRYIERGGRKGRVYASRLVRRGVYGLTRNPMYTGNMMIATGLCLVSSAPTALMVVLPFFLFVYHAIVFAEEAYLRERFGQGYAHYCATVNRFWPSFQGTRRAFAGMVFNWPRALRQDLGTITGLLLALVLMPWWRAYWLDGRDVAMRRLPWTVGGTVAVLALYGVLHELKKSGRLHSFLDTAPLPERRRRIRRAAA